MIPSTRLRQTLAYLDSQYSKSLIDPDPVVPTIYCKAAVIEICGWVEQCFDDISIAASPASTPAKAKSYLSEKVKRINGMDYDKHCKHILVLTLGMDIVVRIEDLIEESAGISRLRGELTTLCGHRNVAAHTHTGVTSTYISPSIVINKLNIIEPIISDIHDLASA